MSLRITSHSTGLRYAQPVNSSVRLCMKKLLELIVASVELVFIVAILLSAGVWLHRIVDRVTCPVGAWEGVVCYSSSRPLLVVYEHFVVIFTVAIVSSVVLAHPRRFIATGIRVCTIIGSALALFMGIMLDRFDLIITTFFSEILVVVLAYKYVLK